jgi:RimJ/RimL family protein N-acetyltransferase
LTYFAWVNDSEVRSSALNTDPVHLRTHLEWFSGRLIDADSYLFVLEAGDLPVGQIRFELHGEEATIDYSLDVLVRGRGWANQLVKLGIEALNTGRPAMLTATVKPENAVSAATFIRLGFVEQAIDGGGNRRFLLPSFQIQIRDLSRVAGLTND